jgi:hypothetical protein
MEKKDGEKRIEKNGLGKNARPRKVMAAGYLPPIPSALYTESIP